MTGVHGRGGHRRRWLLAIPTVVVLLLIGGYFVLAPHKDIPMPGKRATPAQVVEAYIYALNARDYETSNAIFPTAAHAPRNLLSRWEHIDLKRIENVEGDQKRHAWVHFTADFSGGDGTLQDGLWGYVLQRDPNGYWRITDQGVV